VNTEGRENTGGRGDLKRVPVRSGPQAARTKEVGESERRKDLDPVLGLSRSVGGAHEHTPDQPSKLADRPKAGEVVPRRRATELRSDGEKLAPATQEEVDLGRARFGGRPVGPVLEEIAMVSVGAEDRSDPSFEERPPLLRRRPIGEMSFESAGDPCVE
jgi:hypothetical protein